MKKKAKPVFKPYNQNQPMLIPPSYEDLVPANHPVRVVNAVIDRIDISALESSYRGGGTSSYDPRMLLKVVILRGTPGCLYRSCRNRLRPGSSSEGSDLEYKSQDPFLARTKSR